MKHVFHVLVKEGTLIKIHNRHHDMLYRNFFVHHTIPTLLPLSRRKYEMPSLWLRLSMSVTATNLSVLHERLYTGGLALNIFSYYNLWTSLFLCRSLRIINATN